MHSISLHVPDRLRSIRSSIFRSSSSSIASSTNSQRDRESTISTPSTSFSSSSPPAHKPSARTKSLSPEHYIPPVTWGPTTNEPHRLNSFVNTLLRKESEPSCTPRPTSEKRRRKEIAAWQPAKKLKYPVPPLKEHAEMLEAWRWDTAGLDSKMADVMEEDYCSCISPRGSRRNSFGDEYWAEEKARIEGGEKREEKDGALGLLDALMKVENARGPAGR